MILFTKGKGINYFWSIKNSNEVLNKFKSKTFQASVSLTLCCFVIDLFYVLPCVILSFCVFSHFSIAITSLREERDSLCAFRTFVRFALVLFCLFPLPLGVWEGLRFVIVALPGLFSYLL